MLNHLESTATGQTELKWSCEKEGESDRSWTCTLDFMQKEGKEYVQKKPDFREYDDLNKAMDIAARHELNGPDTIPFLVRDTRMLEDWKSKDTVPSKKIGSKIQKEFKVDVGTNVTLSDVA